jgi:predicted outer membrane protein
MRQVNPAVAAHSGHTDARRPHHAVRLIRFVRLILAGALLALLVVGLAPPRSGGPFAAAPAAAAPAAARAAAGISEHLSAADRIAAHQTYTRLLALGGTTQTKWGPLTAADREVLIRVRLANLWERPVSLMAQEQAGSQRVKDVGAVLAADHLKLDGQVRELAKQLGMDLPDQPNALQQGWVAELTGLHGQAFDVDWANRLRSAHGTVFGLAAEDRAATENSAVRDFAQTAVNIVMKHMTLLESTGLFTPLEVQAQRAAPIRGPISLPVITIVVGLILVANLILARRRSWN